MIAKIKQRLPAAWPLQGRLLDRVILWTGLLLVASVVVFGTYYYFDQTNQNAAPSNEQVMRDQLNIYEQAVRDDPNNITNRLALADTYLLLDRYADAAAQYEAALAINDETTLGHVGLGQARFEMGDFAAAAENFQKIIKMYETEDISGRIVQTAYYFLGRIALEQDDPDEAVKQLTQATNLERSDADAWFVLGTAYRDKGDLEKAVEALEQAALFVPDFTEAFELLAQIYADTGAEGEQLYARGMVAYSKGDLDEATRQLLAAVRASPTLAVAHAGLGLVLENNGQKELALQAYQEALHLDPENFNARTGVARLTGSGESGDSGSEMPADHPDTGDSATEQGVTP